MFLGNSELKITAELVCKGYSKLKNVATGAVVHTDTLELIVGIGRGHRWVSSVVTILTPWKPALQWGHCAKMSSLLSVAMAMITPTQCVQTTAHPHGSKRTCGFLSMQATQRGAASRICCSRGGLGHWHGHWAAAGEASWRGRRLGRG